MSYVYTSPGMTPTAVPTITVSTVSPNTVTYPNQINWGTMSTGGNGSTGTYTIATDPNLKGASLQIKGNAEFEGDVTFEGDVAIKGKSIKESLLAIEERLAILRPNEKLEEKWENLRELRKQYMELEAEIIEKEAMWAILKK
jgi:hypothetical protein